MIYWNWTPVGMRPSVNGAYILRSEVEPTREGTMIYWNWTPVGMRPSVNGAYILRSEVEPTRETRLERIKRYVKRIGTIGKSYEDGELQMMLDELNAYLDEKEKGI